jgi:predicted secreted protein
MISTATTFRKFITGAVICGALVFCGPMPTAMAQSHDGVAAPNGVVNLQASASVEVGKDVLAMMLTTVREGVDAAAVQAGLKQALDSALQEGKKVAKAGQVDVQTGNFSLSPRYGKDGKINGWVGTAELLIEGRDMAAIGQLAGRITSLNVGRVSTSISRELREKTESLLLAQAIARFRAKAAQVAQQFEHAGHSVREVTVSESEPALMPQDAPRVRSMAAFSETALPVEAGKTTVTVNVIGSVQMHK